MSKQQNISPILSTRNLAIGYVSALETTLLVADIDLDLHPGELVCLIGPNGSGKTTLIKTLIGLHKPVSGLICIENKDLSEMDAFLRAQYMGVVLTNTIFERNLTVSELVAIGRYAHTNWLGKITKSDKEKIDLAIESVGLKSKYYEPLYRLSDGERQRAILAKVLAQDVNLIILDEPTAHLDLPNKVEVFALLHKLAALMNKGILISTHELELAFRVSDRIMLIGKNTEFVQNTPEDIIMSGLINQTFGNEHIHFIKESASFELINEKDFMAKVIGQGLLAENLKRLLKRYGYSIAEQGESVDLTIEVEKSTELFLITYKDLKRQCRTFSDVQQFIVQNLLERQ